MISTKGRYALRLMLDLAQHENEGCVALKDVAQRQNVSKKYLEQIVPLLTNAGMLRTTRGYRGGYMIAEPPEKYTVGDILRITEGSLAPVSCLEDNPNKCARAQSCMTLGVWSGLHKVITQYLDSITLRDIIDSNNEREINEYYI